MFLFQASWLPEMLLTIFHYEFMRDLCGGQLGSSCTEEDEEAYKYIYSRYGKNFFHSPYFVHITVGEQYSLFQVDIEVGYKRGIT